MKYDLPFVPNTEDNLHCLQAAYLMIVKYFKSDFEVNWDEWSKITGYEEGKGTWPSSGLLWLKDNGFEVQHVSLFDYGDFSEHGGDYLIREYGEDIGAWQVKHSNIPLERKKAKLLIESGIISAREPSMEEIKRYLDDGYLIHCLVNSRKLNSKKGYFGHAIVVSGYDDNGFIIQDPGLPPLKDREVAYELFEKAWADPNNEAKELDAIKLA